MPWKDRNAASVTTNDGMPTFATMKPIASPMTRPVTSAASVAAYHGQPWNVSSTASTDAHTPLAYPAERSISPSSSTKTRPIAMMVTAAPWVNRFAKLPALKNAGRMMPKNTQSAISPSTAGSEPMSPPRTRLR